MVYDKWAVSIDLIAVYTKLVCMHVYTMYLQLSTPGGCVLNIITVLMKLACTQEMWGSNSGYVNTRKDQIF